MVILVCLVGGASAGMAASNAPVSSGGTPNYSCDEDTGFCTCSTSNGDVDCREMLDSQLCQASDRVDAPWADETTARANGQSWIDYLDCDRNTGRCTCELTAGTASIPRSLGDISDGSSNTLGVARTGMTAHTLGHSRAVGDDTPMHGSEMEEEDDLLGVARTGMTAHTLGHSRAVGDDAPMHGSEMEEEDDDLGVIQSDKASPGCCQTKANWSRKFKAY